MSEGGEPSTSPAAGGADARITRLERELHRIRAWLIVVLLASVSAILAVGVYFEGRHIGWRADTIVAHRFVLEHEGRTRAELSMHAAGWPQLLLEPDMRFKPGVAIAGRGELVVRGDSGWRTDIFGSNIRLFGPGDRQSIMLEQGPGHVAWIFYDDAGRRVLTSRKPGERFRHIVMDSAETTGPVVRPR